MRSLALVLATVTALVVVARAPPWGRVADSRAEPASIAVCPPLRTPDDLLVLPPDVHDELVGVRDAVAADRASLVEVGVFVSAVRVDPVLRRVRVLVSGALPIAAGHLAHLTDPALVCIEPGGVTP